MIYHVKRNFNQNILRFTEGTGAVGHPIVQIQVAIAVLGGQVCKCFMLNRCWMMVGMFNDV